MPPTEVDAAEASGKKKYSSADCEQDNSSRIIAAELFVDRIFRNLIIHINLPPPNAI